MEKAAAALELGPLQVRRANLIGKHEFPYTGVNKITYDEGSYRESLDLAERTPAGEGMAEPSGTGSAARGSGRASATRASPSAPPTEPRPCPSAGCG